LGQQRQPAERWVYNYNYDNANHLITTTHGANVYTYRYNGFGDRKRQTPQLPTPNGDCNSNTVPSPQPRRWGYKIGPAKI